MEQEEVVRPLGVAQREVGDRGAVGVLRLGLALEDLRRVERVVLVGDGRDAAVAVQVRQVLLDEPRDV